MPKTNTRVDAYIDASAPFARPILVHLRQVVHRALPECEEGIKWGMPHFMLGGKNVAGMSAFKAHCAFVIHGEGRQGAGEKKGMGGYGKVASLADLPPDEELVANITAAAEWIASRGSAGGEKAKRPLKPEIPMPKDFALALAASPEAKAAMDAFAPSHRREYLQWITEAKQDATRARRIAKAIEMLAEGKKRNWKYENC